MARTEVPIEGKTSLKSLARITSAGEPEGFICPTTSLRTVIETGSKTAERGINMDRSYVGSTIADLINSTLFTKKEKKEHMSAEAFRVVAWDTFRIELMGYYDNLMQ